MRTSIILALSTLIITAPSGGEAQRGYKVYKTDRFGNKEILSEP